MWRRGARSSLYLSHRIASSFHIVHFPRTSASILSKVPSLYPPRRMLFSWFNPKEPLYAVSKNLRWKQLEPDQRAAWEDLGWTQAMWEGKEQPPASMQKEWVELTDEERAAAGRLGYDQAAWTNDEAVPHPPDPPPLLTGKEPFVICREQRWMAMDPQHREAWIELGWSEAQWDSDGDVPASASSSWETLTPAEKEAATRLGYTPASWDAEDEALALLAPSSTGYEGFVISKNQSWDTMNPNHRAAWQTLGWSKESWEGGGRKPETAFQGWADLNDSQKSVASSLGYTQTIWDGDEMSLGSRIEEGAYKWVQSALGASRDQPDSANQAVGPEQVPLISQSSSNTQSQPMLTADKPYRASKDQPWDVMKAPHRQAWETLGWTKSQWEGEGKPRSATQSWADLSEPERLAAIELGYTEAEWNEDGEEPSYLDWFKQKLYGANSVEDNISASADASKSQKALEEPPYVKCKRQSWDEMESSHRAAWEALGWTKNAWDDDGPKPTSESLDWNALSDPQKKAAMQLGFTEETWNQEDAETPERTSFLISLGRFLQGQPTSQSEGKTANRPSNKQDEEASSNFLYFVIFIGFALLWYLNTESPKKKEEINRSGHFWRKLVEARESWQLKCEEAGLAYHSAEGIRWPDGRQDPYWADGAAYVVDESGRGALELAAWRLHHMCLQAVDEVVASDQLMDVFEIPVQLRERVRMSWKNREPDVLGRFDLLYDGVDPPKMLEYNADTPTILIESARAQADWLRDQKVSGRFNSRAKQFNDIDNLLQTAWTKLLKNIQELTVISTRASQEEAYTADYIAQSVRSAGFVGNSAELTNITYTPNSGVFDSTTGKQLKAIWKLYPYEWLCSEELGQALLVDLKNKNPRWFEPAWKLIVGNKSILPLLWQMFPDHPNLLPAFFDIQSAMDYQAAKHPNVKSSEYGWVAKPKFGREGLGVRYSFDSPSLEHFAKQASSDLDELRTQALGGYSPQLLKSLEQSGQQTLGRHQSSLATDRLAWATQQMQGTVKDVPFPPLGQPIFQEYYDPPVLQGRRPVLGLWMVHGTPAGLCFREDIVATTNNDSCFVPHVVVPPATSVTISKAKQKELNGTYIPIGRLGEHELYEKEGTNGDKDKTLYLKRGQNSWQISPVLDSEEFLAEGETKSVNNFGYFTDPVTWTEYDPIAFDFVKSPLEAHEEELPPLLSGVGLKPLNSIQAQFRRELYADFSEPTQGDDNTGHSPSSGVFLNRHFPGGTSSSSRPSGSWSAWGKKPHPTGSHGSTMGSNS